MINHETGEDYTPFIRTAFNYNMNEISDKTGLECLDPTLTQQQYKEECDINTILERFKITGDMPENFAMPMSADISEMANDYHTACNAILAAEEAFMELPAKVRARFENDPQELMDFLANPDNRDEAQQIGLIPAPTVTEPIQVIVTNPAAQPQG